MMETISRLTVLWNELLDAPLLFSNTPSSVAVYYSLDHTHHNTMSRNHFALNIGTSAQYVSLLIDGINCYRTKWFPFEILAEIIHEISFYPQELIRTLHWGKLKMKWCEEIVSAQAQKGNRLLCMHILSGYRMHCFHLLSIYRLKQKKINSNCNKSFRIWWFWIAIKGSTHDKQIDLIIKSKATLFWFRDLCGFVSQYPITFTDKIVRMRLVPFIKMEIKVSDMTDMTDMMRECASIEWWRYTKKMNTIKSAIQNSNGFPSTLGSVCVYGVFDELSGSKHRTVWQKQEIQF